MNNIKISESIQIKIQELFKCTDYDSLFRNYNELIEDIDKDYNRDELLKLIYDKIMDEKSAIRYVIGFLMLWKINYVEYVAKYLSEILHSHDLSWENKYFIRLHIIVKLFTRPELSDDRVNDLLSRIYNLCTE